MVGRLGKYDKLRFDPNLTPRSSADIAALQYDMVGVFLF